ncbi:MAG TPA: L,D-transpeptidase [Thermomicrobiales bacterium]|nr:L,D-transpeptidase [Thermomicrobiales bacterium]
MSRADNRSERMGAGQMRTWRMREARSRRRGGGTRSIARLLSVLMLLVVVSGPLQVAAQDSSSPPIVDNDITDSPTPTPTQGQPTVDPALIPVDAEPTADSDPATAVFPSNWSPPRTVYIPETGQTIDGWFLDLWRQAGGANAYGYPITPEITLYNGHVVQYYSYARFEYWPEGDADGNFVRIGNVGEELQPAMIPRGIGGRLDARTTELARAAQAWMPLPKSKIKQDSETWRYIPETGHSIYDGFKAFWEASGEQWYLGFPLTEEYIVDGVSRQVFERGELTWQPGENITMVPVGRVLAERYGYDMSPRAQGSLPIYSESLFVPPAPLTVKERVKNVGADPNAEKWLEVNLTTQSMKAWQGDVVILETLVSTGKERFETPAGTFFVNSKLPEQDMEGILGGEYYNVPKVPDVMYFTDRGHAIHGAYWHNNFGTPMSHGCINLPMDVADFIYAWAPVGMRVEIHN